MEYIRKDIMPLPENLEKVGGHSLENLLEFFENKVSKIIVNKDSDEEGGIYIRDHRIIIKDEEIGDLEELRAFGGQFDISGGASISFYAYHEPTKKFDYSKLHGIYEFNKGQLVERVRIRTSDAFNYNPDEIIK